MIPFSGKKTKKQKQNKATIMISVDGKGTTFPVFEKTFPDFSRLFEIIRGIFWIKILKREFLKRSNEFNWDKSPD